MKIWNIYIPNDKYENYVSTHIKAPVEHLPTKHRAKCYVQWELLAVRRKQQQQQQQQQQ